MRFAITQKPYDHELALNLTMKIARKLWINEKWHDFSEIVKRRDGYKCLQCQRDINEVILQVHHDRYMPGKAPWEYSVSNCLTLCKGCHSKKHGLIEPDRGWTLISIDDLGDMGGVCERKGCGNSIRYEHITYHPNWGYKVVGSTCIEHLTQEDRLLSSNILDIYKKIAEFVHSSDWLSGFTTKGNSFIYSTHGHHAIRIYGNNENYSFQIVVKEKGVRRYEYHDVIYARRKSLEQVKELSYIVLKGTISNDDKDKSLLRDLYRHIKYNT